MMMGSFRGVYREIRCGFCDEPEGQHTAACPLGHLGDLRRQQRRIPCPKCDGGVISINDDDFFECRQCHVQFTRGFGADTPYPEEVYLENDRLQGDYILAHALQAKGRGKFPLDVAIEEAEKRLAEAQQQD